MFSVNHRGQGLIYGTRYHRVRTTFGKLLWAPAAPSCPGRVARLFAVVRSRRAGGLASHLPTRFGGFAGYLLQSLARGHVGRCSVLNVDFVLLCP